LGRSYGKRIDA